MFQNKGRMGNTHPLSALKADGKKKRSLLHVVADAGGGPVLVQVLNGATGWITDLG